MTRKYNGFRTVWSMLIFYSLSYYIFNAVILNMMNLSGNVSRYIWLDAWQIFITALIYFIIKSSFPTEPRSEFIGLKRFNAKLIPVLIFLPVSVQIMSSFMTMPVNNIIYSIFGEYNFNVPEFESSLEIAVMLISVVIISPFAEEWLIRGITVRLLRPYGFSVYVFGSALAFALIHFDITSFCNIFILGVVFALVRYSTNSVFPCMIMHSANNLFSILLIMSGNVISEAPVLYSIFVLLNLVACPILMALTIKFTAGTKSIRDVYSIPKYYEPGFSLGLVIYIAIYMCSQIMVFTGGKPA